MKRPLFILLKKELLELRADRKAVVLGVFLPVFLYPLLLLFSSTLERRHETLQENTPSRIALLNEARSLEDLFQTDDAFELISLREKLEPTDALAERLVDAVVDEAMVDEAMVDEATALAENPEVPTLRILHRSTLENSRLALSRVRQRLERVRSDRRQLRYEELGGTGSLDSLSVLLEVDVATPQEAGGARAARQLVYLLLMTLFISGAALANDLVAGEKERGTIETLYLLPVPRREIALSKALVVVGGTSLSGILSLLSISACTAAGWIGTAPQGGATSLSLVHLAGAALLILPLALFLGSLLLGISTFARSLKESQQLVLPAMLLCFGAGVLSMSQAVRVDSVVALVPVANVALAIRDLLAGQIHPVAFAVVILSSLLWGAWVLRWVTQQLQREEMVLGFDPEPLLARTKGGRRRAAILCLSLSVLAYFYLGSLLQSRFLTRGVLLSLWVLLPLLGVLTLRIAGDGSSLSRLLSWNKPRPAHLAAAILGAWGLMLPMMGGWMRLQAHFLPAPQSLSQDLQALFVGMPWWQIFFLGAVSPAICEELLFRGVFLGLLRRTGTDRAAVITTAVFFGLTHLSIFRFVPTTALGLVLGLLVVRSGSIVPAMLFHLFYNGTLLSGQLWLETHRSPLPLDGPVAWGLSLLLLLATSSVLLTRSPGDSEDGETFR